MKPFNLLVHEPDLVTVLDLVRAHGDPAAIAIAGRWRRQLESERRVQSSRAAAEEADAELRRSRAANATLTERQAHMLGAARAGKSWSNTWTGSLRAREYAADGRLLGMWLHHRSMGGAISRMREKLEEEGLLEPRNFKLTAEGLERLERWEADNRKSFPKADEPPYRVPAED